MSESRKGHQAGEGLEHMARSRCWESWSCSAIRRDAWGGPNCIMSCLKTVTENMELDFSWRCTEEGKSQWRQVATWVILILHKEKFFRASMKRRTGAQRGSDISILRGFQNSPGQPAVTLKRTFLWAGEISFTRGEKVSRVYQEETIANNSYHSSTGVLMISLVILRVYIFSAVQKLLGVCCDSLRKCCHRQRSIMLWLCCRVSWLAVNPALFLRQIPFLETHVYLLLFLHLSGVTQAPMEFYMVPVVTNGQKSNNTKWTAISALYLAVFLVSSAVKIGQDN